MAEGHVPALISSIHPRAAFSVDSARRQHRSYIGAARSLSPECVEVSLVRVARAPRRVRGR
eukprot:4818697-Prymnesium_polylepis.2